jgi:hypothetical protein
MIIGLIRVPQSSTATNRRTLTCPVPGVDVDDADVGAEREREIRRVVDRLRLERALDALRQLHRAVGGQHDLLDRGGLLRVALDEPTALLAFEVGGRGLEHRGGDEPRLVAHLPRHDRRGGAGHRRRARAVRAQAERRRVSVAVDDLDVLGRDAELLGHDLGERRLVALPWVLTEMPSTALPVGCTRSSAPSAMPRPAMSMCLRGPAPTVSLKNDSPMPISSPRARFSACSARSAS